MKLQLSEPATLKYKWTAFYSDGKVFHQNEEDKSAFDPKKSAFFDVDHQRLIGFSLQHEDSCYTVDLVGGFFLVNNLPFRMHPWEMILTDFKLVFTRRHYPSQSIYSDGRKETGFLHDPIYRIGWQAKDFKGNLIERIMEID